MAATSFKGKLLLLLILLLLSSLASAAEIVDLATTADHKSPDDGLDQHHAGSSTSSTVAWSRVQLKGRKMGADGTHTDQKGSRAPVMEVTINGANKKPPAEACSEVSSRISLGARSYISIDNQDMIAHMETSTRRSLLISFSLPNTQSEHAGSPATVLSASSEHDKPSTHPSSLEHAETHNINLLDAAYTEISTMLTKDYGDKAHSRIPVHNQHHLDHENAETHS